MTLSMVVSDEVYFACPSTFNDPLDTHPSLQVDVDTNKLKEVLRRLVERRTNAQNRAAANLVRMEGPRTEDHIENLSRRQADQTVRSIEYNASNTEYGGEEQDRERLLLRLSIEQELLCQYDKGIVSLAESSTCPLMWSHYGDQHKGICIGYSIPERIADKVGRVQYVGDRYVRAEKLVTMLEGCEIARREVDRAVLFRKAKSWQYEREWRLIGSLGIANSPMEMEELIFGMRCTQSMKYAVVKALEGRERNVEFFETHEIRGSFGLERRVVNQDELLANFPIRSIGIYDDFKDTPVYQDS